MPYFIGIAGGTGSGKSTFAQKLCESFPSDLFVISCDNYYKSQSHLTIEQRNLVNYDCPSTLDLDLLASNMKDLKSNSEIYIPEYDFITHTRRSNNKKVSPKKVIVIDGILLFYHQAIREMLDLKIFIDVSADERILRRMQRDVEERGRTMNSVIQQYRNTVKPMHERYVEPTKQYADIIINGGMNETALSLVKNHINSILLIN